MLKIFKSEPTFDFVGRISTFWGISGIAVVLSLVILSVQGLNLGIDFAGGYELQLGFPEVVSDADIVAALEAEQIDDVRVQSVSSDPKQFILVLSSTDAISDKEALEQSIIALAGGEEKLLNWSMAESGQSFTVQFDSAVSEPALRNVLTQQGLSEAAVKAGGLPEQPEYKVVVNSVGDKAVAALRQAFNVAGDHPFVQSQGFVGNQVGRQFRTQGVMAVLWALGFIALYIGFRFDLFFAPGAILALLHDVCITLGVFSLLQLEFNLPIIAAILTIVGYSLNDTIVVYDRIRENTSRLKGRKLGPLVNASINQTLSRTLLTSLTTLFVIVALLVMGAGVIRDFSAALLIGVIVGTYSSVAIASPVYVLLRRWFEDAPSPEVSRGHRTASAAS